MNRFAILVILFTYYLVWLLLPIFELEDKVWLFPLPSKYAVILPILLVNVGVFLVVSFLGLLLVHRYEVKE
ncbi:LAQU0S11e01772g1_1 [Lachancea quebecensis]|uniref:Dolichol phosphate-mannose biosynthesis regulatory protein n=1 Tax=Lachancea quebecensis TaxID=1654605 RepID=A0A0P1KUF1_9SACH|nr:LAQU0S11e01772g1_1 [Lachancea quebecensis]